jgi:hypothetical protein
MEINEIHSEHEHATTSLKVVLLVFAIVLVGALAYLVWAANTAPDTADNSAATVKTTTVSTADWKTYTSTSYAYSLKYPSGWSVDSTDIANISLISPESDKQNKECISPCEGSVPDINIRYYASVADDEQNKGNNLGAKTLNELIQKDSLRESLGTTKLGGVSATQVLDGGFSSYYSVYAENNSHLYAVSLVRKSSKSSLSAIERAILASFKFNK